MKKLAIFGALILLTLGNTAQADQTGDCTQGTEFCESLETTNTTNTTNANTNTNTNTNQTQLCLIPLLLNIYLFLVVFSLIMVIFLLTSFSCLLLEHQLILVYLIHFVTFPYYFHIHFSFLLIY
jgi:hypothetical protein